MAEMSKRQRIDEANAVIAAIAAHGRRFFYHAPKDRTAHFQINWEGRLAFRDEYTNVPVSLHPNSRFKGFSNGGTCEAIVRALHLFIRTGEPMPAVHFGPWNPEYIPDGDLWGYGAEAMQKVRDAISKTGAVACPPWAGSPAKNSKGNSNG